MCIYLWQCILWVGGVLDYLPPPKASSWSLSPSKSGAMIPLYFSTFLALSSYELQLPHFIFLEKDTDQFILLTRVLVCLLLPCRYLASWEKIEQSGFGTALVCFFKTQETRQRPALACNGRRANLKSRHEREWEVKNEEQNKSAAERELTTLGLLNILICVASFKLWFLVFILVRIFLLFLLNSVSKYVLWHHLYILPRFLVSTRLKQA